MFFHCANLQAWKHYDSQDNLGYHLYGIYYFKNLSYLCYFSYWISEIIRIKERRPGTGIESLTSFDLVQIPAGQRCSRNIHVLTRYTTIGVDARKQSCSAVNLSWKSLYRNRYKILILTKIVSCQRLQNMSNNI